MPIRRQHLILSGLALLALAFAASACTNTEYVEVERPPFNPAPDSVAGFLGLYTVSTNQTTCGNCHVSTQAEWVNTRHAGAYATLANTPGAQASCYGCHTVSEKGNTYAAAGIPGGWNAVPDSVYHNVQCESCHGPGLTHVTSPTSLNVPLASGIVTPSGQTCVACHSGAHHPFAEQWSQSAHANLRNEPGGPAETPTSCGVSCHSGAQAMARLSGNAPTTYIGQDTQFPITCAVCHDPHAKTNSGQLRAPIDNPDVQANLCSGCHTKSANATPSFTINSRGAHASQGAVYFGEAAGWAPPGFVYDPDNPVQTSHVKANPRLCAGCHVVKFTTTDASTGEDFTSVGHLFSPNPCKDANGLPTIGNCDYTATARFWNGCTTCHADAATAAALFNSTRASIKVLVDILWIDSDGDTVLEPTDGGLLAQVLAQHPGTTVPATDSTFYCCTASAKDNSLSIAEGALFNARMLGENLYPHNDGSKGVHNPALYRGLLAGSIDAVRSYYGFTAALSPEQEAAVQRALSAPGIHYTRQVPLRQTAAR